MQPVHAMRTGRSILVAATILTLALAIAAGAVELPGSAAANSRPNARSADACSGSASLAVSDRRPSQLRPVRFSAAASTVPAAAVAFYDISYGDGSDDAGAEPSTVHAYSDAGTYAAKLSIVTTCDTIVTSPDLPIVVSDGLPPAVAIAFPKANQVAHFGRAGLLLSGTARDPSGVRRVELAMQLVSVKRSVTRSRTGGPAATSAAAAAKPGCYWYDGHLTLRVRGCTTPLYFPAHLSGGRWSFRMNPRSQIPPGVYTARVRATDRLGNISTVFSTQLGNILAFTLVA